MSMFDDVLGLGRTAAFNEAVEPELENDDFDSIESLDESVDSMDFMIESIFTNEMNMERIDRAIMCEEYTYLRENGEEMVYEAGKIETIISKAKATVLRLWNQIQKFLKTQADNIVKKADKDFLKKYENKAKGKTGYVKGASSLLKIEETEKAATTVIGNLKKAAIDVADKAFAEKNAEFVEWEDWVEQHNDPKNRALTGLASVKDRREEQNFSADEAIAAFRKILAAKNSIKSVYSAAKDTVNGQLKALKKMESSLKKFKVIPTEASSNVHKAVRTVNKIGSTMAVVCRTFCKRLNMSKSMCKAIIISAAAKDRSKTESTIVGGSFLDSVELL